MSRSLDSYGGHSLRDLFEVALFSVRGDTLAFRVLSADRPCHVIALGKAGEALAFGAWKAAGRQLHSGFLAVPRGYETGQLPAGANFERHAGAHPLPDAGSLEAGQALKRYVSGLPHDEPVAVLLSGGGSACVEYPAPGVKLDLLRRVNAWLIRSGLPITGINAVRARLSLLKNGGLAHWLGDRPARGYVLSDILKGGHDWVAGAPLSRHTVVLPPVPAWLRSVIAGLPARAAGECLPLERLAGNWDAVAAISDRGALAQGILAGGSEEAARELTDFVETANPGTYAWGAETTLKLPARAGRGGRCRHLALAVALRLAGNDDWELLSAGTDGWDGTDAVAGACVDGGTVRRGRDRGHDAAQALQCADSGRFFAGSGEEIVTGPTGTNVNDLLILRKRGN